jgi:hypothetical protein
MYNASQQQLSGSPVLGSDSTVYYSRSTPPSPRTLSPHILCLSFDGSVYAVHSATAAQRWNFTTRGTPQTPALSSGSVPRLFVASMDATLYALSATGTLIWSFPAPSQQGFSAPPVVGIGDAAALVLAGNMDGRLYAVEQSSGALVWVFSTFPAADTSQLSPVTVRTQTPIPVSSPFCCSPTPPKECSLGYPFHHLLLRQRQFFIRRFRFGRPAAVAREHRQPRRCHSGALARRQHTVRAVYQPLPQPPSHHAAADTSAASTATSTPSSPPAAARDS